MIFTGNSRAAKRIGDIVITMAIVVGMALENEET